jgi:hypothetical protein
MSASIKVKKEAPNLTKKHLSKIAKVLKMKKVKR